jgi:hypothetical protein
MVGRLDVLMAGTDEIDETLGVADIGTVLIDRTLVVAGADQGPIPTVNALAIPEQDCSDRSLREQVLDLL